jgi:hypothetical protein
VSAPFVLLRVICIPRVFASTHLFSGSATNVNFSPCTQWPPRISTFTVAHLFSGESDTISLQKASCDLKPKTIQIPTSVKKWLLLARNVADKALGHSQ